MSKTMSTRALDPDLLETLRVRFKQRVRAGLALARTDRFLLEMEPSSSDEPAIFAQLSTALRGFRRALRAEDTVACLDAMEATWACLEACNRRVGERDRGIEAFRLRWAGENAAFSDPTIDALARFYRRLPFSKASQSKYEYVLTRRLAGPLVPDRRAPPTEELLEAMAVLESSWEASPSLLDDEEAESIVRTLKGFGQEAGEKEDAAAFTASALLRRFSAFKVSLGPKLYDKRVSVAVVETNVRVLNVLNDLLTAAGGQPLRGVAGVGSAALSLPAGEVDQSKRETGVIKLPSPRAGQPAASTSEPSAAQDPRSLAQFRTAEIDLSGLELVVRRPRRSEPEKAADAALPRSEAPTPEASPEAVGPNGPSPPEAASDEAASSRTEPEPVPFLTRGSVEREHGLVEEPDDGREDDDDPLTEEPGEAGDVEAFESEQLPSSRAFELGKTEENAAIIERYLTKPRSPEVWRLNLDSFLSVSEGETAEARTYAPDRRRALDLILASDDLIHRRRAEDGASTPEHRIKVKELAQSMLRLQTSLRRAAGLTQGDRGELEPLLYVSDHLLWERLRLTASLTRNTVRKRAPSLPRATRATEAVRRQARAIRRHRRILVWAVGVSAMLTLAISMVGASAPRPPIDPEVQILRVGDLPQPQIFTDARAFRSRVFITADLSWTRLENDEQRSIVLTVADYALGQGFDTLSIVGPRGEAWATFMDGEVILESELTGPATPAASPAPQ